MNEYDVAEQEIRKVARRAHQMFTRKKFYKPGPIKKYKPPVRSDSKSGYNDGVCEDCGRPKAHGSGRRCRECFGKQVHRLFKAKVRAENERVGAAEAAFQQVLARQISMAKKSVAPTITRSTSGLRNTLFEEMEALRNGTSNAQRARSMAQMANAILQSVHVEIEYHKYVRDNKARTGEPKVVSLGTDIPLVAELA